MTVIEAINYILRNDCDFITVETLQAYTGCTEEEALAGMIEVMGQDWVDGKVTQV